MKRSYFKDRVSLLHFAGIEDNRGELIPIDFSTLGFAPVRSFVITGKNGVTRGGHAHRQGAQLLVRIAGEIRVDLQLEDEERSFRLGPDSNAILIRAPVWSSQTYLGDAPSLIVFSDHPFDPSGYIDAGD